MPILQVEATKQFTGVRLSIFQKATANELILFSTVNLKIIAVMRMEMRFSELLLNLDVCNSNDQ